VNVRYGDDYLEIEVTDDGRGAAAPLLAAGESGGHGLIGMKERVALYGGELQTGPVFPGGYRVFARLPLEPDDSTRARREREASLAALRQAPAAGHRERPARKPGRAGSLVAPRVVPPMLMRVVPPHRAPEESRDHGRGEPGGEL
jgi:Signal transduction histidine kinase